MSEHTLSNVDSDSNVDEIEEPRLDLRESENQVNNPSQAEVDLATKMLQIQHKRFYLDVKQYYRGRFIKIAERMKVGPKSRLLLAMPTALEFRDHLFSFMEHCERLSPVNTGQTVEDKRLKSETMVEEDRLYYIDLKENNRGRFLRLSQIQDRGDRRFRTTRSQIAIPAQGIKMFHEALSELLEKYATPSDQRQLPDGSSKSNNEAASSTKKDRNVNAMFRAGDKKYYFDVEQNRLGVYMRISQVQNNYRARITVPEKSWSQFRDALNDCMQRSNDEHNHVLSTASDCETEAGLTFI